ncbi:hypothetical protein [Amycolatopsis orientalis]|uniref:hypothetical protein n=1 Tax=Amycolatopsis orientalis TaxID=31958 RepID=UPI0003FCE1A2|nr:hypothetical protein [Amycolatopsis orientalis]
MTENAVNLLLVVPALAVVVVLGIVQAIGVPESTLRGRREAQVRALRDSVAVPGARIELDWSRYKEVPKERVLAVAGEQGWTLADEEIQEQAWVLRFTRS